MLPTRFSNHGNDVYDAVLLELSTKHWLASTGNPCHCVRSKYLNVILKVITKSTMDLPGEISKNLSEQMVKLQDGSDVVQVQISCSIISRINNLWFVLKMSALFKRPM